MKRLDHETRTQSTIKPNKSTKGSVTESDTEHESCRHSTKPGTFESTSEFILKIAKINTIDQMKKQIQNFLIMFPYRQILLRVCLLNVNEQ